MPRVTYTDKQKIQALKVLETEPTIYSASKLLGIPQGTLKSWKEKFKVEAKPKTKRKAKKQDVITVEQETLDVTDNFDSISTNDSEDNEELVLTNQEIYESHLVDYTRKAIIVKNQGLAKMSELIRKANRPEHLKNVTDAVRMLHESIAPKEEEGKKAMNVEGDLFQTIVNQYGKE